MLLFYLNFNCVFNASWDDMWTQLIQTDVHGQIQQRRDNELPDTPEQDGLKTVPYVSSSLASSVLVFISAARGQTEWHREKGCVNTVW